MQNETAVCQMILGNFYQDNDLPEVRSVELLSWLRVLNGCSASEILAGWERYQENGPRSNNGRLGKPVASDIRERAMKVRHETMLRDGTAPEMLAPPQQEERPARTDEQRVAAEHVMKRAGYSLDLGKKLAARPLASSRDDLAHINAPQPHWTEAVPADDPRMAELRASRDADPLVQAARKAQSFQKVAAE